MAQLVRIGPHEKNLSKHTTKGYGIHRIGLKTFKVFGQVQSRNYRFYWVSKLGGPQFTEVKTHRTIQKAKAYVEKMLKIREEYHSYRRLEKGDWIRG